MMKAAFFSLLLTFFTLQLRAQNGYTRLSISGGLLHKDAATATIALEFGKEYHSYTEVFADVYKNNEDGSKNYLAGAAYKPNITRSRNTYLNFRAGAGIGSDTDHVIGGLQLGFEGGYIFPRNFVLMLHQKNEAVLGADHPLRTGLLLGVKISL